MGFVLNNVKMKEFEDGIRWVDSRHRTIGTQNRLESNNTDRFIPVQSR